MSFKHLELVRFSEAQKQFFNALSDSDKPRFIFNCPALIDCTFLFLGESPSHDFKGHGYFMPVTNQDLPNLPRVIDCHLQCFVTLTHGNPPKTKQDKYKDALIQLTEQITLILANFDKHFLFNDTLPKEYLEQLAFIANALDFANDRARLSVGLPLADNEKEKALKHIKSLLGN